MIPAKALLYSRNAILRGHARVISAIREYSNLPNQLPPILPIPAPADPNASSSSPKSFFTRFFERYSPTSQRDRIRIAELFYLAATRQASDPRWFGPGRIARDFRSRHALLTMHVWFLHKRLIHDDIDRDRALMIQEELFNILWEDTLCRIRAEGVTPLLENRSLLKVQQYTFLHLTHYDHAFTEFLNKPEERLKELRKVIWQHVLVRDEEAEHRTDHLNRLAWYVEANYQNIMLHWPNEYYQQGRVAWVNLPDFSNLLDEQGNVMEENPVHPEDVLPEPWAKNITLRGKDYYWNTVTNQVSWERPTSFASHP
ncbi:hypothetical protein FisN_14Hh090 [Fistulifera solaris]|uniref:WW domain-containing protein n=1 Tax=Fistulifera solaris TaxID=1519565 RepID=A0A1Z5K8B9_FISSO|nr:hypothetical protein FisN_14Hh090 [Fistulifera solaris]|eukprot:GAX22474.1 hypothetical protein FisN_14Hh090 [Fistulifera solaris]